MAKVETMRTYKFHGINRRGRKIQGTISEANTTAARKKLKDQNIKVHSIRQTSNSISLPFQSSIKSTDIATIFSQIATMIQAGMPLIQSLQMITDNIEKPKLKELIIKVRRDIEGGISFSNALKKHPLYFDNLTCSLIATGEVSGKLDTMLKRVASYKEKSEITRLKVKKALKYPVTVIIVALVVAGILLVRVIPVFKDVFTSFNAQLPTYTQMVVNLSNILVAYWYIALIGLIALIYSIRRAHGASKGFREFIQRKSLDLPIVGDIIYKSIIARYCRTLATTSAAGLPIIEGLEAAGKATANIMFEEAANDIREDVMSGERLYAALRNSTVFPNMAVQMVSAGEESGALDAMLDKVATYYEAEVDNAVDGLTAMLEPMIMAIIGVLVGALVIAMYLPIFTMGSVV